MSQTVQVLVYDLTRGMAAHMSPMILGTRIEGVWHTGVQVFDREYYYGGGIQASPIGMFALSQSLPPVRVHDIGVTTKTKAELETFLRSINHQFSAMTYDLLRNNCNNFSDAVCMFLLGQHIPTYIIDLPNIVFNTPGGAAFRPMIEQMQSGMYAQQAGRLDPFGSSGTAATASYASVAPGQATSASIGASVTTNNITTSSSNVRHISTVTAILEEQPLVSNDGGRTVELLGNKIINLTMPNEESSAVATTTAAATVGNEGGGGVSADSSNTVLIPALSDEEKDLMRSLITTLSAATTTTTSSSDINNVSMSAVILLFHRVLDRHVNAEMACLFLLRLVVLRDAFFTSEPTPLILAILHRLQDGTQQPFKTPPAIVMALCVISNLLGSEHGRCYALGDGHQPGIVGISELLLDVILKHLTHSRAEIRQISATALYNLILAYTTTNVPVSAAAAGGSTNVVPSLRTVWDSSSTGSSGGDGELSGLAVQVFLGCMEEIFDEIDTGVRHRRLCSALRIVRAGKEVAVALGKDLGFSEMLSRINVSSTSPENERHVVMELRRLLA